MFENNGFRAALEETKNLLGRNNIPGKKIFISYAWEDRGSVALRELQNFIGCLSRDLRMIDCKVFFDLEGMTGDMEVRMRREIESSDYFLLIGTPRYRKRALATGTNVAFEYELIMNKIRRAPEVERNSMLLPICYSCPSGDFGDVFPNGVFPANLVRDFRDMQNYHRNVVAAHAPIGILPHIYPRLAIGENLNPGYTVIVAPYNQPIAVPAVNNHAQNLQQAIQAAQNAGLVPAVVNHCNLKNLLRDIDAGNITDVDLQEKTVSDYSVSPSRAMLSRFNREKNRGDVALLMLSDQRLAVGLTVRVQGQVNQEIELWDIPALENGNPAVVLSGFNPETQGNHGHYTVVTHLAELRLNNNQRFLVSTEGGGTAYRNAATGAGANSLPYICLWDLNTNQLFARLVPDSAWGNPNDPNDRDPKDRTCVVALQNGNFITGSIDTTYLRLWNIQALIEHVNNQPHGRNRDIAYHHHHPRMSDKIDLPGVVYNMVVLQDGRTLAISSMESGANPAARIFRLDTQNIPPVAAMRAAAQVHQSHQNGGGYGLVALPDGRLASSLNENCIHIGWDDVEQQGEQRLNVDPNHVINELSLMPDGMIVGSTDGGGVRTWNIATGLSHPLLGDDENARNIQALPDGTLVSNHYYTGKSYLWRFHQRFLVLSDILPFFNALAPNRSVLSLNLEGIPLGDAGANVLAALLRVNVTLVALNIRNTRLSSSGTRALISAIQNHPILSIVEGSDDLIDLHLSPETHEEFRLLLAARQKRLAGLQPANQSSLLEQRMRHLDYENTFEYRQDNAQRLIAFNYPVQPLENYSNQFLHVAIRQACATGLFGDTHVYAQIDDNITELFCQEVQMHGLEFRINSIWHYYRSLNALQNPQATLGNPTIWGDAVQDYIQWLKRHAETNINIQQQAHQQLTNMRQVGEALKQFILSVRRNGAFFELLCNNYKVAVNNLCQAPDLNDNSVFLQLGNAYQLLQIFMALAFHQASLKNHLDDELWCAARFQYYLQNLGLGNVPFVKITLQARFNKKIDILLRLLNAYVNAAVYEDNTGYPVIEGTLQALTYAEQHIMGLNNGVAVHPPRPGSPLACLFSFKPDLTIERRQSIRKEKNRFKAVLREAAALTIDDYDRTGGALRDDRHIVTVRGQDNQLGRDVLDQLGQLISGIADDTVDIRGFRVLDSGIQRIENQPPYNLLKIKTTGVAPAQDLYWGLHEIKYRVPQNAAVNQLLRHVALGEQDEARDMLEDRQDLLLFPGTVTDLSEREFQNITPFQYAVWGLDYHMWTMLREYLPDEIAGQQLRAGLNGRWVGSYGEHAGLPGGPLDKLARDLETYIKHFSTWHNNGNWNAAIMHWCEQVGGAQRLLPVHVINEYCRPDRPFDPCPSFTEPTLPRTRTINQGGEWFTAIHNGGQLGVKFAAARSASGAAHVRVNGAESRIAGGVDRCLCKYLSACICDPYADRCAIVSLTKIRMQQRDQLCSELIINQQRAAQRRFGI